MAANDQTLSWMTFTTTVQQRSVFTQSLSLQKQLMLLWLCPNNFLLQFSEERLKLHNFVKGGFTFIWLYLPVYKNITVKNWLSQCLYIFEYLFLRHEISKSKEKTKDDQKYNINFWKLIHRFFFFFFLDFPYTGQKTLSKDKVQVASDSA